MTPSTEQSTPGDHLPTSLSCKKLRSLSQPSHESISVTLIVTMESCYYHACIRRSCQQRSQSLRMGCVLPCSWEMFQYIAGMCVVVYWFSAWQDLETPWRQISRYVCVGLCGKDLPLMNKYFRGPITGDFQVRWEKRGEEEGLSAFGMEGELGVKDITN